MNLANLGTGKALSCTTVCGRPFSGSFLGVVGDLCYIPLMPSAVDPASCFSRSRGGFHFAEASTQKRTCVHRLRDPDSILKELGWGVSLSYTKWLYFNFVEAIHPLAVVVR